MVVKIVLGQMGQKLASIQPIAMVLIWQLLIH